LGPGNAEGALSPGEVLSKQELRKASTSSETGVHMKRHKRFSGRKLKKKVLRQVMSGRPSILAYML